ncbi:MAG: tRNA (guanosine(37)-N1)-methyltransferase TrmD [Myxococcota bacterium]|nr:tRNA (guanosine(37)-N1)-methyltransferase TrmD [Myxococcota bacterium]
MSDEVQMRETVAVNAQDPLELHLITLFPEEMEPYLSFGVLGRAVRRGLLSLQFHNPRDFAVGNYRQVDAPAFGGGPGVVIQAEPVARAIEAIPRPGLRVLFSPSGRLFSQEDAERWANERAPLTFVCGRYEGIDGRIEIEHIDDVISVGDYVLSGGELPALIAIDAVARLLPGALNNQDSARFESHSEGLLEHPHYTRPALWRGHAVPEVLRSGHHAQIADWREARSRERTTRYRPDLLKSRDALPPSGGQPQIDSPPAVGAAEGEKR